MIAISALFFVGFLVRMGMAILSSADPNPPDEAIRNIGLALAAVVGLPFLVWRSIVAQQQVRVAEQGQITDRINKAVEGLGAVRVTKSHITKERKSSDDRSQSRSYPSMASVGMTFPSTKEDYAETTLEERTGPNIEVRLGALFSLERIAQDSPRDHITVMEIICAYVRENAPVRSLEPSSPPRRLKPRTDIQAAFTVLSRRTPQQLDIEKKKRFRLDLSFSNLSGIDFENGNFNGARFANCKLEFADFSRCSLNGSRFSGSILNYASFADASLIGSGWNGVTIDLTYPSLLAGACIKGLDLSFAKVPALDFIYAPDPKASENRRYQKTFGSKDTVLNDQDGYTDKYKSAMETLVKLQIELRKSASSDKVSALKNSLQESPFEYWSRFDASDLGHSTKKKNFYEALGLTGWPYDDD